MHGAQIVLALYFVARLRIQFTQTRKFIGNFPLKSTRGWGVPARLGHALWQIGLPCRIRFGLIMRRAIGMTMPKLLHQFSRRIAQMNRYGARPVAFDKGDRLVIGHIARITLGRDGQIQDRLRQGELTLG